eukprot:s4259_g1.t1
MGTTLAPVCVLPSVALEGERNGSAILFSAVAIHGCAMGNCVATLRNGIKKRQQESQRLKSKKEDNVNLLEEPVEAHSFAIYIIDNKGEIEEFYDVEDTKIGEGSFGRVCKCTNKSTGAERAVKMLRKVRRKSQLIMFKNELSTLKMLDHPHIVKLYEHFEDGSLPSVRVRVCLVAIAFPVCPLSATVFLVVLPLRVVGQMIRSLQGQLTALSHRADSLQVAVVELAEEISKLTTPGAFGDWALVDDQFPPLPAAEFQALIAIHRRRGVLNGPPDLPDECLRIASRAMIFSSEVILDRARDAFNSGFEAKVALVTGNPFLKDPLVSTDKHRHWVCLFRRTPDYNKRLSTKKCLDIALAIEEDVVWQGFEFVAELVIFCAGAGLSVPRLERWVSPW